MIQLDLSIDSLEWLERKLKPVLKTLGRPGIVKAKHRLYQLQNGQFVQEWEISGPKLKPTGFDPVGVRAALADDPARVADFLWRCAVGKLPMAAYQYLLGPITQRLILAGHVQGPKALKKKQDAGAATAPSTILEQGFDEGVAKDEDVLRVADKRSFDNKYRAEVLKERPHLLDKDGNPLR